MLNAMQVLDPSGHTTVEWDTDDEATIAAAEAQFTTLRHDGYVAYSITEAGSEEIANRFDPNVRELVMTPALAGG